MYYCLGVEWLGSCTEYYTTELSIYSLGSAIGASAIILAFIQLIKPSHELRLYFRNYWRNFAITLMILNFICIFIASFLPILPGRALPFIGYPLFWEILAGVLFFISIIIAIFIVYNPIKTIKKEQLELLKDISVSYLSQEGKKINILMDEMVFFFKDFKKFAKENNNDIETLFLIYGSDSVFCKSISKNFNLLNAIFAFYNDISLRENRSLNFFIENIIKESLDDENSLIAKELNGSKFSTINKGYGITLSNLLYDLKIIKGANLLNSLNFMSYKKTYIFKINYILFFEKIFEKFFDQIDKNIHDVEYLLDGFEAISGFLFYLKNEDEYEFTKIFSNFGRLLKENENKILKYYEDANVNIFEPILNEKNEYCKHNIRNHEFTIFDVAAFGMYEAFEKYISTGKEKSRLQERDFSNNIYDLIGWKYPEKEINNKENIFYAIQVRLNLLFKKRIKENLDGGYASLLKVFFHIYGYSLFSKKDDLKNVGFIYEILKILSIQLPNIKKGYIYGNTKNSTIKKLEISKKKGEKILKGLLPDNCEYDYVNNKIIYYFGFGEKENWSELDLNSIKDGKYKITKSD